MKKQEVTVFLTERELPYVSGVLEDSEIVEIDEVLVVSELKPGSKIVDWQVESTWKKEDSETVLNVHVLEHKLSKGGAWWFKYRLEVKVNAPGEYKFTDRTGDVYHLKVSLTSRVHYVDYNSDHPEIVLVEYKP